MSSQTSPPVKSMGPDASPDGLTFAEVLRKEWRGIVCFDAVTNISIVFSPFSLFSFSLFFPPFLETTSPAHSSK